MATLPPVYCRGLALAFLTALAVSGVGCATAAEPNPAHYRYFSAPAAHDAWSPKIAGWQRRALREEAAQEAMPLPAVSEAAAGETVPSSTNDAPDLRAKYLNFRADRKRALAREVASWVQSQAPIHYVEDGVIDHWATLEETLASNGDDCDGLELLTFHALRDLGFGSDEVFRAVIFRPDDGQHHMVTLWFEETHDPWVIDPTGAMTLGMPRMSEFPGWVPLKLFTDRVEFTVQSSDLPPGPYLASHDELP